MESKVFQEDDENEINKKKNKIQMLENNDKYMILLRKVRHEGAELIKSSCHA
jgi:hypothetical protein